MKMGTFKLLPISLNILALTFLVLDVASSLYVFSLGAVESNPEGFTTPVLRSLLLFSVVTVLNVVVLKLGEQFEGKIQLFTVATTLMASVTMFVCSLGFLKGGITNLQLIETLMGR